MWAGAGFKDHLPHILPLALGCGLNASKLAFLLLSNRRTMITL